MLIPCAFVQSPSCGSYPAMAGNPAGYGYSSGYGSYPAMDGDSAGYYGGSGSGPSPATDRESAGYGYVSGYGSSPAMAMNSAGYYGRSGSKSPDVSMNTQSASTPILRCLHTGCEYQTKLQYDFDRHQKIHLPPAHATQSALTSILLCLHPGCDYQTKRQYDLDRHQKTHLPSVATKKFDCTAWVCGRTGEHGFDRKVHLREHMRKVHRERYAKGTKKKSSIDLPRKWI